MKIKPFLVILVIFSCLSCSEKKLTTNEIIDKTVEAYGGQKVYNSIVEFDFRDKHYSSKYYNHQFSLKRTFSDSTGNIIDELNNDGFVRLRNDTIINLNEEWTGKYARSVNSVIYFFRIPFVFKDGAVIAKLLDEGTIRDTAYFKLEIGFSEDGGGEDFDDKFVYWVNKETFHIDYFAYSYSTDGGGKRFRETINPRTINGLRVEDYINYKPKDITIPITEYDSYFEADGMIELSRIENKNVQVTYLD